MVIFWVIDHHFLGLLRNTIWTLQMGFTERFLIAVSFVSLKFETDFLGDCNEFQTVFFG